MLRAISIAKAKGKSIGFSECGTGSKGNPTDPTVALLDDVEWVKWFWRTCQSAISPRRAHRTHQYLERLCRRRAMAV